MEKDNIIGYILTTLTRCHKWCHVVERWVTRNHGQQTSVVAISIFPSRSPRLHTIHHKFKSKIMFLNDLKMMTKWQMNITVYLTVADYVIGYNWIARNFWLRIWIRITIQPSSPIRNPKSSDCQTGQCCAVLCRSVSELSPVGMTFGMSVIKSSTQKRRLHFRREEVPVSGYKIHLKPTITLI